MLKFVTVEPDGSICDNHSPLACSFGITESIALAISAFAIDAGVGAATAGVIGEVGAGALVGAGVGAGGAAIQGKDPLKGAEFGAISGGVASGVSPFVGELGLGAAGTGALSGALGGVAGGLATGGDLGTSALTGGLAGGISGALKPTPAATASTPTGGPTGSAVSSAAPSSVAAGGGDVTAGVNSGGAGANIGSSIGTAPPGGIGAGYNTGSLGTAVGNAPAGTVQAPNIAADVNVGGLSSATPAIPAGATGGGVGGWIKENPWAVPAAAIGFEAMKGTQPLPGQKQLETSAGQLRQQGATLQNYFQSGTLPPGIQSGISTAAESAKASIRSMYASRGMSGSSAEQQDIAAVGERAVTQGSQIALGLLQQGVSETGMANQLYLELMQSALQQDQQLGQALASFSSAMIPALAA